MCTFPVVCVCNVLPLNTFGVNFWTSNYAKLIKYPDFFFYIDLIQALKFNIYQFERVVLSIVELEENTRLYLYQKVFSQKTE